VEHELPALGRVEAVVGGIGQSGVVVEMVGLVGHAAAVEIEGFVVAAQVAEGEGCFGAKGPAQTDHVQFRGLFFERMAEGDDVFPPILGAKGRDFPQQAGPFRPEAFFGDAELGERGQKIGLPRVNS